LTLTLRIDTGSNSVLRQVAVPIFNWEKCRNLNSNYQEYVFSNMICVGTVQGGKSSCNGDSGGPLVCKQGDRWFEYGIVNFRLSKNCAEPNRPSMYASVVTYLSWIQEKTGGICLSVMLCM